MKTLRLVLIALVSSLFVFVSNCTSATSTPMGTTNAYLDAIVAQNTQAMVSYESEDYGGLTPAQRVEMYETFFDSSRVAVKSYSITNRNLTVESETETTATVSASYDVLVTYTDDTSMDDTGAGTYYLTKVGSKWLLSEPEVKQK